MMPHLRAALAIIPALLPVVLHAQGAGSMEERNRAFLRAAGEREVERIASFFPRDGEFTWIGTVDEGHGRRTPARWRLRRSDVVPAFRTRGPLCESFADAFLGGAPGLTRELYEHEAPWRRVSATRFVPRRLDARSPYFVEWRREGGSWVIASFGDMRYHEMPGTPGFGELDIIPAVPGRAAPEANGYAADARWFRENLVIRFLGLSYIKDALPRALAPERVRRVGTLGNVPVFAGATMRDERPEIILVPERPGEYQPYRAGDAWPCRW